MVNKINIKVLMIKVNLNLGNIYYSDFFSLFKLVMKI